ncbi:hypothetical protein MAR_032877 [Mya arenaria]|uniref:Uncharacterized protein n=1 Tax=Mya arenaria TaxID=6604 RepID=A0ABY7G7D9_MYAAR|nr:hypothetical protein MAR_032877 [Mya arenaria]
MAATSTPKAQPSMSRAVKRFHDLPVPTLPSALAKFRSGVAPIRLETGRYERLDNDVNDRICPFCNVDIEDEMHRIQAPTRIHTKRCAFVIQYGIFNHLLVISDHRHFLYYTNAWKGKKQSDEDFARFLAVHNSIVPSNLWLLANGRDEIIHVISAVSVLIVRYFKPYKCKIYNAHVSDLTRHLIVGCYGTAW